MDKQQITTWIEAAQQEVDRISREGTARRCIPVQPTDTDILLRDGAEMMAAALEHIEALEAELEAANVAVDPPLDNKPAVIRRFRLIEVSEDEAE